MVEFSGQQQEQKELVSIELRDIEAILFFKKHGFIKSKSIVQMSSNALIDRGDGSCIHVNRVKRLVESWELVNSVQVLSRTGYEEVMSHLDHCDPKWCHFHSKKWKQAIADVESCNE